jgi:RNA-directed DNA polymerase
MSPMATSRYEWKTLPWRPLERTVFKLQKRIFRASRRGNRRTVHRLQRLLLRSWAARCLAVRKVTQDNRGKQTAGVDGVKSLPPARRLALTTDLASRPTGQAVRRVWIPKPGTPERRPLGIPTLPDRAAQTLVRLALEPEGEARFEPNVFGFRPGRAAHDAIEAIFTGICKKPKYVLDADIAACFERIDHAVLLKLVERRISDRRLLKLLGQWLQAGVLDAEAYVPSDQGVPQGGVILPLLANVVLHELDRFWEDYCSSLGRLIRYADDVRHIIRCSIPFAERRGSEGATSGSTAYPAAKAQGDCSMPLKRGRPEDAYGRVSRDPRDMVKGTLLEPESPAMEAYIPRAQRL